ncbi:MAG: PHP domain-containing protein [Candidatus Sumerlaeia bacterium]
MNFVHLHTHSHYSLGRGVPAVEELVKKAAELEMPAIALTDNNSIAGLNELVTAADKYDIQPIIGCELDVLPSQHGAYQGRTHRLTLLVRNEAGYRNLVTLISSAHSHTNQGLPPHVRFQELLRCLDGLVVMTGSPRGELYHNLREGNAAATKDFLNRLASAVGEGNLYFEIMEYPHPRTRKIMDYVLELSRFLGVPAVATQNVHFLEPRDILAYCAQVQSPKLLSPRWPLPDSDMPTRHMTTPQEMQRRFGYTPELMEQSLKIAEKCQFRFPSRRVQIPVPEFDRGQDAHSVLWDRAIQGASVKYGGLDPEIKDRLNKEYGDIRGIDSPGVDLSEQYLLLADIMAFLRRENLAHGVGRGAWLHSVIAYVLGIVETDPLAYELEYLSPREEGGQYPLFQLEVSSSGMEKTIAYLKDKYGENAIMPVGRRADWKRADLFKRLCRWAGLAPANIKEFSGKRWTLVEEEEPEENEEVALAAISPESFMQHCDDEENEDTVPNGHVEWSRYSEIPRNRSFNEYETIAEVTYTLHPSVKGFEIHRGHYVLCGDSLMSTVPLMVLPNGQKVTQADMHMLDRLQMPRIQFVSMGQMNIMQFAQDCVCEESGQHDFSLAEIPENDPVTYEVLGRGLTNGIPSLYGITTKSLLRARRPKDIYALCEVHAEARQRRFTRSNYRPIDSLADSILGYRCAWLKAHEHIAFMASALNHSVQSQRFTGGQRPRFQILLREARKMNIPIFGPDINFSKYHFSIERGGIRTGLMAVQEMGESSYREIEQVRVGSQFTGLEDFCHRIDSQSCNQTQVINLIKAGAFDILEPNRKLLLMRYERALKNARPARKMETVGYQQLQLFDPSMFEDDSAESKRDEDEMPDPTSQEILRYEQDALGYSISHDIMEPYRELMAAMHAISPFQIHPRMQGKPVYVVGFVDHAEKEGPLIDNESEIVLDLEGIVVKAGGKAVASYQTIQESPFPVLIEGTVKKHKGAECFLVANRFYSLEDIRKVAAHIASIHISLGGEDRKTVALVRSLVKTYRGETPVEIEGKSDGWFGGRKLQKGRVFCCPPFCRQLSTLLAEHRIHFLDQNGNRISRVYN